MKKTMLFVPLLMLISCGGVKTTQIEHNGSQAYQLSCNEFNSNLDECKARVAKLCTNGYQIINHYKEVYADAGDGFYMPPVHHITARCS